MIRFLSVLLAAAGLGCSGSPSPSSPVNGSPVNGSPVNGSPVNGNTSDRRRRPDQRGARGFEDLDIVLYTGERAALVNGPWDLPGGYPFTLVLERDGEVHESHRGPGRLEDFRAMVERALASN